MALSLMILSGWLAALSNLCMRHCLSKGGTIQSFFLFQLFLSFCITAFLHPLQSGSVAWNSTVAGLGVLGGLSLGAMKWMLGRAVQSGSSGLSFAVVNAATVFPALFIGILFTPWLTCTYTVWNGCGSVLVIGGLFWAACREELKFSQLMLWALFALGAFAFHLLFLLLTEWRVCLQNQGLEHSPWFVPITFAAATGLHLFIYGSSLKRWPTQDEIIWGISGGILNGLCAFLFMVAAEVATPIENGFLFPTFSISLIIACHLWGQFLYQEKVHWPANALCLFGLAISHYIF